MIINSTQLVPPTFNRSDSADKQAEVRQATRTCDQCGQFIGVNPLVAQGIIPASLAEILIPPPIDTGAKKTSTKRVVTGRVISADEMLQTLKVCIYYFYRNFVLISS